MSDNFRCVSTHVESLAGGRSAAPLAEVTLTREEQDDPYNVALIASGALIPIPEEPTLSRKELQARAEELDIEGRSKMSVDELRSAIAVAEEHNTGGDGA